MFKPNFGICVCHKEKRLIVVKAGYCAEGNEEQKRAKKGLSKVRAPIKKVSEKRKALDLAYSVLRKDYLKNHPLCEIAIRGVCTYQSSDIHHLHSGPDRLKYMNDFTTVKATCRNCHSYAHNVMTAEELRHLGLKL